MPKPTLEDIIDNIKDESPDVSHEEMASRRIVMEGKKWKIKDWDAKIPTDHNLQRNGKFVRKKGQRSENI